MLLSKIIDINGGDDGVGYFDYCLQVYQLTTADINGGNIDGTSVIVALLMVGFFAGTFTDLTASGTTTVTTADINGGNYRWYNYWCF